MFDFVMQAVKFLIKFGIMAFLTLVTCIIIINLFVILSTLNQFKSLSDSLPEDFQKSDVPVIVLGAGVINNETPSKILEARLDQALALYHKYPQKTFIMSGDHREDNYNEVAVMKNYLVNNGIPSEQIYLDHAGYSTYDSMYRLKNVINVNQAIIVTQGYHLSRALMVANYLQIKAIGFPAVEVASTRFEREFREVFARLKDFAVCYLYYRPSPPDTRYSFSMLTNGNHTNHKDRLND